MAENLKKIRWKQRFQNFEKAHRELSEAVSKPHLSKLERTGLIKTFEFTFELAWKTLKDFLESEGLDASTPREVIKLAFQNKIITNGGLWIEALENRNLLAHTYEETLALNAEKSIKANYFQFLNEFHMKFLKLK